MLQFPLAQSVNFIREIESLQGHLLAADWHAEKPGIAVHEAYGPILVESKHLAGVEGRERKDLLHSQGCLQLPMKEIDRPCILIRVLDWQLKAMCTAPKH
jgi:hypothetical protein